MVIAICPLHTWLIRIDMKDSIKVKKINALLVIEIEMDFKLKLRPLIVLQCLWKILKKNLVNMRILKRLIKMLIFNHKLIVLSLRQVFSIVFKIHLISKNMEQLKEKRLKVKYLRNTLIYPLAKANKVATKRKRKY